METDPVRIDGLRQFTRDLKRLDSDLPKAVRVALNAGADIVIGYARPRIPTLSGKAQSSLRAKSTRTKVRVSAGGRKAPYYPWLDFGGRTGRRRSIIRPFEKEGRYLYKAYFDAKASGQFQDAMQRALLDVARQAGVEVRQT